MLKKCLILLLLLIILAGGGIAWYYFMQPGPAGAGGAAPMATGAAVGNQLPAFVLSDEAGRAVNMPLANGQVTVLNFWASWCPPCRGEMPELAQFAKQYHGVVNFYAVNLQESPAKVQAFLQGEQLSLPMLFDSDGAVSRTLRITAIPTTLIVDKNGVIRFRKTGSVTREELRAAVTAIQGGRQ